MSLEAAYHEAAHAVLAARSRFHNVVHDVDVAAYGSGDTYVSVSRKKCVANGIPEASALVNAMVIRELVKILCAGYAAECVAQKKGVPLTPNATCSGPDYQHAQQALIAIGLPKRLDEFKKEALGLVEQNWADIEKVAMILDKAGKLDAVDLLEMLQIPI